MNKRILSFVLSFAMIFGVFSSASAAPSPEKLEDAGKQVRVIVELEKEPIIKEAMKKNLSVDGLSANAYNSLNSGLLNQQESVKKDIKKKNIDLDYHESFTNVVNGFSATTTLSEIKTIENMPGVKSVSIADEYHRPTPLMETSKDIINTAGAWNLNFKGEGLVVAVIDSGIDPSHQDMKLTDPSKGKIKSKDISLMKLPGKFYTDKVPYGYNYIDKNDTILDARPSPSSHGMHVAGTVGANGVIKGVAPEVQLLAMKVFGNDPKVGSTYGDIIIKAIDDSIKLGADVINMSLGYVSSFVDAENLQTVAIKNAVEAGVVCSVSAGNSNHILDLMGSIDAANPDYGVVGAPGLSEDSIQVAAIENTHVKSDGLSYQGKVMGYTAPPTSDANKAFAGKKVEYFDGGDGSPEFLSEAEGKIALVVRGGETPNFTDKIQNAIEAGAAGVIIRNHETGGDSLIDVYYPPNVEHRPAMFIGYTDGMTLIEGLKEGKNTVEFLGEKTIVANPYAGKMADYSSWGPTPSLDFKPEITAPGGNIYSTIQDNKYEVKGGTSMSAPHVSGGSALVIERINKDFNVSGREKAELVKNLVMSTAVPLEEELGLTSPRRQGAGIMNLLGAVTTDTIVTDSKTGISKVELKEVGDNIEFTLKLKNFGSKDLSYSVSGVVQTDLSFDGMNLVQPQEIMNAPIVFTDASGEAIESLDVKAEGETEFKVSIDLSEAVDFANEMPLDEVFENGTFIDGFISLKEETDTEPSLSIPYMGFYGEWDKAPILDSSVYELDKMSYYMQTGLTWLDGEIYKYLGSPFEAGDPLMENIAFSPNGDGLNDVAIPALTFIRNGKEVQVNILDKNGALLRVLSRDKNIIKNYFGGGGLEEFRNLDSWNWDGKVYGKVTEGEYIYQIKTKIDFPGAAWQKTEFPIKLDLTKPVIESIEYDKEANKIDINAKDNMTPIYKYEVISKGEVILETADASIDLSGLKELPTDVKVKAYDYALNFAESKSLKLREDGSAPFVYVDSPEGFGTVNTNQVEVKGYVTSVSELTELKIYDKSVDFKYDAEAGKYNFSTTLDLKDGVYRLRVYAKNSEGKDTSFERRFYVDAEKPELSILTKPARLVDKDTETVKAKIKIKENSGTVRVLVQGSQVFKTETDWHYTDVFTPLEKEMVVDIPLQAGDNDIKIIVEDGFGNKTEESAGKVYRKVF